MAGGKLSARQKMINLMYLIFIAMLAMNMDKKVLTAFGTMNETINESTNTATTLNTNSLESLGTLAIDQPGKYVPLNDKAKSISALSNTFNTYLAGIKTEMLSKSENPEDYETMDNPDNVDTMFFIEGKQTDKGKEFVSKIETFKNSLISSLGEGANEEIVAKINKRFNTDEDKRGKNGVLPYLESKFEGFPLIASVTNISRLQSDIKTTENEIYSSLVGGQMKSDVSMNTYEAMVVFDKNAYYPGERLQGKIILAKKDASLTANKVIVNGAEVAKSDIVAGQVNLNRSAGNVGEQELKGQFFFTENGEEIPIDIVGGKYSVIPRPNDAVISADKMNVVYRGLPNPISISIPGISDNKVVGSASGMTKTGKGKYVIFPPAQREVTITASGSYDGGTVRTPKTFRVKGIPAPTGMLSGESGYLKMSKANLARKTVGAELKDFVFDLKIAVSSFKVKVPGKPTIEVSGTRFNAAAKRAIQRAKRGDVIIIFDIKAAPSGANIRLKNTSQVSIQITS